MTNTSASHLLDSLTPLTPQDLDADDRLIASAQAAASEYLRLQHLQDPELRKRAARFATEQTPNDDNAMLRKVELLERNFCEDRKDALYKLKTMRVGQMVIVNKEHTNHMRVACHYHRTKFKKQFRTETMTFGVRGYLRIVRTE